MSILNQPDTSEVEYTKPKISSAIGNGDKPPSDDLTRWISDQLRQPVATKGVGYKKSIPNIGL